MVFSGSKMDGAGAYGGGKAGAPFDPIAFVQRPQVILRAVCLVSEHDLLHLANILPLETSDSQ